jgi:hypothetical protein
LTPFAGTVRHALMGEAAAHGTMALCGEEAACMGARAVAALGEKESRDGYQDRTRQSKFFFRTEVGRTSESGPFDRCL